MNLLSAKIRLSGFFGKGNGVVWIAISTIAAGIAWQLVEWLSNLNAPSSNFALAKLVGVTGLASVIILLHRFDCRWAIGFSGAVFLGFACYHFANLGKPCGCLSKSGISTYSLLFSNLMLAIVLFSVFVCSYAQRRQHLTFILSFAVLPLAALTLFLAGNQKNSSGRIWSLCDYLQRHHPFYFSNEQPSFDVNDGDFNIVIVSKKCEHCRQFIEQNYGGFISDFIDLTDSETFAIVECLRAVDAKTTVFPVRTRGNQDFLVLPVVAKLSDSIVVDCRELN